MFDAIITDTGLCLDVVCSGRAKGGTSTDGKQRRHFFNEEVVPTLKRLTKEKYHGSMLKIHMLLSAIMHAVSSQQRVNISAYMKNCNVSILIANYKWVQINHTLHGLIHHSGELIIRNDGYALGSLSEEGLEATNKFIRRFLELLSRKTCPIDQLTYVMSRLLERSNPKVLSKMASMKQRRCSKTCLHCDSTDHTTRQHQKVTAFGPRSL